MPLNSKPNCLNLMKTHINYSYLERKTIMISEIWHIPKMYKFVNIDKKGHIFSVVEEKNVSTAVAHYKINIFIQNMMTVKGQETKKIVKSQL